MITTALPSVAILRAHFNYDPATGEFTHARGRFAGRAAGSRHTRGYVYLKIKGRQLLAHRVAFALSCGDVSPALQVDHINCVRWDNRLINLRAATPRENNGNTRKYKGDLPKGVCRQLQKFEAAIRNNGSRRYLGVFNSAVEAHEAYCRAAHEVFGEFARPS